MERYWGAVSVFVLVSGCLVWVSGYWVLGAGGGAGALLSMKSTWWIPG